MAVNIGILGMNARNFLYIRKYNPAFAKKRADNKLATKKLFLQNGIQTTAILHSFTNRNMVRQFDFASLPKTGFAIKPARGYEGKGILVFKNWQGEEGETTTGKILNVKQITSHLFDIFEGIYSLQSIPDQAYIEERVTPDSFFKKLAPVGLPDIRVIVFNKIPVMAMLRLPTKESGGKANLNAGAIGVGVGLRTGITTYAVYKDKYITTLPNSKIKTNGIKVPQWHDILLLATKTQAVCGLGYVGVDIVVDEKKGPVVLEINTRPGLAIQRINQASLRSRLERVEHIQVTTIERGVEIAESLFAEEGLENISHTPPILTVIEPVTIYGPGNKRKEIMAKLDTGAFRTSIDTSLVEELNLQKLKQKIRITSASGITIRPQIKLSFTLGGKRINTTGTFINRKNLQFPMIVGRRDLKGFYINPIRKEAAPDDNDSEEIIEE